MAKNNQRKCSHGLAISSLARAKMKIVCSKQRHGPPSHLPNICLSLGLGAIFFVVLCVFQLFEAPPSASPVGLEHDGRTCHVVSIIITMIIIIDCRTLVWLFSSLLFSSLASSKFRSHRLFSRPYMHIAKLLHTDFSYTKGMCELSFLHSFIVLLYLFLHFRT